jgi:uncharacterized protein DUF4129
VSERRRAFLGIAGVCALVALVAVASRANAPRLGEDAPSGRPPAVLADYLATLALLLVPLGAVIVVWTAFQRRVTPSRTLKGRRSPLASVAIFAVLLAFAFWAVGHLGRGDGPLKLPTVPTQTVSTGTGKTKKQAEPRKARFQWLPVFVLGSIALAFAVTFVAAAARRRRSLDGPLPPEVVAEVLEESLDDLHDEPDPRRAVIRTYARMERTFGAHGVPRRPFEAPREYLERVLAAVQASGHSVRRLTQLFERARFSEHAVDPEMKDEAIDALVALRAELAAPR